MVFCLLSLGYVRGNCSVNPDPLSWDCAQLLSEPRMHCGQRQPHGHMLIFSKYSIVVRVKPALVLKQHQSSCEESTAKLVPWSVYAQLTCRTKAPPATREGRRKLGMIFFLVTSRSNSSPTTKSSPLNLKECFLILPTGNLKGRLSSHTTLGLCSQVCVGCCV